MAVTFNGNIYKKTEPGYYASFDDRDLQRPVIEVAYLKSGTFHSKFPVVDLDTKIKDDGDLVLAFNGNVLGAFIYKMYAAELFISKNTAGRIHETLLRANLYNPPTADPYAGIQPLDFMALTGAKIVRGGIEQYLPIKGNSSPPPRPALVDVPDGSADGRQNMFDVIKGLGLWGLLKHLYLAQGGITFEELIKCYLIWLPDPFDRENYFKIFRKYLAINTQALLTDKERKEFLKEKEKI